MNFLDRQNSRLGQELLAARQNVWRRAEKILIVQFLVSVVFPIVLIIAGMFDPTWKPLTATTAIFISLIDIAAIDREYRAQILKSAQLAESFDTLALDIPWNNLIASSPIDHEIVTREAKKYFKKENGVAIINWYPRIYNEIPLSESRFMCQRTNLWYDSTLRSQYVFLLKCAIIIGSCVIFTICLATSKPLADVLLTYLVPLSPIASWSLREYFRQKDTVSAQEKTKQAIESIMKSARNGECDRTISISRQIQDAIYLRRKSSPLVFPGLYGAQRARLEKEMLEGAAKLVSEYKKTINLT